jgi:His-Xaa-Ser system protein HxsD
MSTPLAEIPEGLVEVDLHEGTAVVQLDGSLYPLPAVYAAAYVFIDRCYVLLDRPAPDRIRITLTTKDPPPAPDAVDDGADQAAALRALVGELANELLACAFRHQLAQDNRVLVETVTMQAMAGAMGAPSLADLADFDFTDEALDDPLGIAQSWEEKHGRTLARPAADAEGEP